MKNTRIVVILNTTTGTAIEFVRSDGSVNEQWPDRVSKRNMDIPHRVVSIVLRTILWIVSILAAAIVGCGDVSSVHSLVALIIIELNSIV